MSIAFVLSGGASLGAVQVGMLRALDEHGIRPDLIVGTSVGALNGAFIAGRREAGAVDHLAGIWRSLRRKDVFPIGPIQGALGYYGFRNSLVRPNALTRLIRQHVALSRLEDAVVPLHVVATEVRTGAAVLLSRGDAAEAILASTAVPAVFPPVRIDGRDLMDGGVSDNTPISHAVGLGAKSIYVLPAGYACTLPHTPRTAISMALQALALMIGWRLALDVQRFEQQCRLHVVPPLCPLDVSPADFGRAAELIHRSYESTVRWLTSGRAPHPSDQAELVRPHAHA
ncbi:MAG: patatin-like phospholipase family protein [Nitrospirota bacterium]